MNLESRYKKNTKVSTHNDQDQMDVGYSSKKKFKLISSEKITYDDICNDPLISAQRDSGRNYQTCNVGQILLLELITAQDKDKQKRFWMTNTHLYWNPAAPEIKLMQIRHTFNCIQKAINKQQVARDAYPLIVVGDFNSLPNSAVYNYVQSGNLKKQDVPSTIQIIEFTHPFTFASAYEKIGEPLSNITDHFSGCLDYIWFDKSSLELVGLLDTLNPPDYALFKALPNPQQPSDHISLFAKFALITK